MQRKISEIAVKMTAVLMAVVVCLPLVMSVMKQNVYAAGNYSITFDYNNGTGKTVKATWYGLGDGQDACPTVEVSDYPTEMSVFEGWYLVDNAGNMTTTEVTDNYVPGVSRESRFIAKAKWSESAYEITIPATTSIDATDKTGSVDFSGKLGKNKEMSIAVSSANENKMVNGSYGVDYTMDKNSFSYDSDGAIKTFSDSINFEVTSEPAVAGSYKDTLTFTITAEAKSVEVTIDHNDGTGTTSTLKLAVGEAVLASLPAITRDGYKFLGWTYVDASGNEVEVTEDLIYDGTITGFKASWVNMSPVLERGGGYGDYGFASDIPDEATAIEFTTEAMPSSVTDYTDVSEAQDGSILAYMDGTTMKVSPKEEGATIYANEDCYNMFQTKEYVDESNITSIKFDNFNTSKVTDMKMMFYGCYKVKELDISTFNTSHVTNMSEMFASCNSLTTLDLSSFDTSNVTDMTSMFEYCENLTTLDVSSFDTSKVTDMRYMFYGCSNLTTLDVSSFDTSKVTNMRYMFYGCSKLTTLDVSSFDTSKVTNMGYMFYGCSNLTTLDVSSFDTSKVTNMRYMFYGCSKLTTLDVSSFDTSKVTNMGYMFYGCSNLTTLDVSNFDTSKVTYMNQIFNQCSNLTSLDLSSFDTTNVTLYLGVFSYCSSLSQITVGDKWVQPIAFPKIGVSSAGKWYALSSGTEYAYNAIPTGAADVYTVTKTTGIVFDANGGTFEDGSTINYVINGDTSTYKIAVASDTGKVFKGWATTKDATSAEYKADGSDLPTDYNGKLYAVISKTAILQSGSDFRNTIGAIGSTATSVEFTTEAMPSTIIDYTDVSANQDGSILAYMDGTIMKVSPKESGTTIYANENSNYMFISASNLKQIVFDNFDTSKTVNTTMMFGQCTNLTALDISGFDTSNVTSMGQMFYGCSKLTTLDLSGFNTSKITDMSALFYGCSNLSTLDLSDFDTANVTRYSDIFGNCSSLSLIKVGDKWLKSIPFPNSKSSTWYALSSGAGYSYNAIPTGTADTYTTTKHFAVLQKGTDFNKNIASTTTAIEFTTEAMPNTVTDYIDVSEAQNESVLAYMDGTTMKVSPKYDGITIYANENCYSMFNTYKYNNFDSSCTEAKLSSISFNNFNTDDVTDMSYMFYYCLDLTSLNMSKFNTSNVENMAGMFDGCSNITTLNVSSFNTSKVTDMEHMFNRCSKLATLNIDNFDTSKVTNMFGMFYLCSSLTTLDVTKLNTSEVENMQHMFYACSNLTSLNVSNFNTSNVENMAHMFENCSSLTELDLSTFDTSNAVYINDMFAGCTNLVTVDVSGFNTNKATYLCYMFYNCSSLSTLDLSSFDTTNIINYTDMFYNNNSLSRITIGQNWVQSIPFPNNSAWYSNDGTEYAYNAIPTGVADTYTTTKPVVEATLQSGSNFNKLIKNMASTVTTIEFTTEASSSITALDSSADVSEAQDGSIVAYTDGSTVKISPKEEGTIIYANTDCSGMFSNLSSLTSIKFDNFDTTKVTDMTNLFYNCTSLTTLDLSSFNTSKVTSTGLMFGQCKTLTTIYVSNDFTTSNVTNSTYMFVRCFKLVGGNGTKYSGSYTDATYARIDTASTPGYFTLKSSTNTTSLNDEAEDDVSILSVASLAKTYSSADFALDGDSAIETANLDDEASEEAVAYYHLNDDEDLNGLLAMSVESISIDGVMMDENAEYDDTKFVIEQSEDGVLTITSIMDEGYPSLDDWKTLIYGSIFTDINEDVTITVSVVGLDENADINGFALVEEQASPDLKEEQTSSDLEAEATLDQEEGASGSSESSESASVVSWHTSSDLVASPETVVEKTEVEKKAEDSVIEATATPEGTGVTSASAE